MEYTYLPIAGGAPLRVSRLGFGCEPLGGFDWGDVDPVEIQAGIRDALDQGWSYFDTAAVYGLGRSERRLGEFLGSRRADVVVATKAGLAWDGGSEGGRARITRAGTPQALRQSIDASLSRLALEVIPIVFLHYPDPNVPIEESIGALEDARRAGKIAALGVSNFSVELLDRAARVATISAAQLECSILNLTGESASDGALRWCIEHDLPVIAYGVLARGLLSGKFGPQPPTFPPTDRRGRLPEFQGQRYAERVALVSKLARFARELGIPMSALAVRWVLDAIGVAVAITGVKYREHVTENAHAMDGVLPERTIREIRAALDHAYSE